MLFDSKDVSPVKKIKNKKLKSVYNLNFSDCNLNLKKKISIILIMNINIQTIRVAFTSNIGLPLLLHLLTSIKF